MRSGWKSRTLSHKTAADMDKDMSGQSARDDDQMFDFTHSAIDSNAAAFYFSSFFNTDSPLPDSESVKTLPFDFSCDEDLLNWAAITIMHAPSARALSKILTDAQWVVTLESLHNNGYHIDTAEKRITLDNYAMESDALGRSVFFRNDLLLNIVRAIRDVWHETRFTTSAMDYSVEDVLLLERVRAADSDTFAVLAAWELRGEGFSDVWRHMIGAEEGDMALAFSGYLEKDPRSLFNGRALAQAFRTWHENEQRVDACDHETLEMLDDLILSAGGESPFGNASLAKDRIEAVSRLPNGVFYLRDMAGMIRRDPFYAGLTDPINQAHLFQIIYDLKVTRVNDVPFRDRILAEKIFPDGIMQENWSEV